MSDTAAHTLELLRRMREETAQGFQQLNQRFQEVNHRLDLVDRKIGVMAETINSMRIEIHALRTDVQTVALAVDEHTARLGDVEKRLPPPA
jgi:chromosome segregation ATPase